MLSRFGYSDLAFKMITREDYPSYGNWVKRGATTLRENFLPDNGASMNHHFWGDVSAWFIKCVAGMGLNLSKHNVNELKIAPSFIEKMEYAAAYHIAPAGKIAVSWRRWEQGIVLDMQIPMGMHAVAQLPARFCFEDGTYTKPIVSGTYRILTYSCD